MSEYTLKKITDIYFPYRADGFIGDLIYHSFFYSYSDKVVQLYDDNRKPLDEALQKIFLKILGLIKEKKFYQEDYFSFSFIDDDGEYDFRGNNIVSGDGITIHLRVIQECPRLDDLRLSLHIKEQLLSPKLVGGGLVIFIAQNGQGKSTLMDATIVERLRMYGGYCITCEDPKEANIEGYHGDGYCSQQSVSKEKPMSSLIRNATRALPAIGHNVLMIGELNDVETVVQGIEASANGNVVLFTGHGKSIDDFLYKLFSMYSSVKSEALARQILKSTLKLAVHWDRLWDSKAVGWNKGIYKGNYLSLLGDDSETIKGLISEGKLATLKNHYKDLE